MSFPAIDINLIEQYGSNVRMLAQQKESKLLPHIELETATGERSYFEQYGVHGDMSQVDTRLKDYDLKDLETARRAVDILKYVDARGVDSFDKARMLADMTNYIVKAQAAQAGRQIDKVILTAALASAKTGKTGSTLTALPSSQIIAVDSHRYDTGSGDVGMTVSKAQEVYEKFDQAQVEEEDRFLVLDPISHQKLITDEKASSLDYIGERPFGTGMLPTFMGMTVIRLPQDRFEFASGSSTDLLNVAFARRGLLGVQGQAGLIESDIFEDKKKESIGSMIAKCNLNFASTRMEEVGVIQIVNDIS